MRRFLLLLALAISLPTLARTPANFYVPFRIPTDNFPQAQIAGWLLPARGAGQGTIFILHGWNNSKEIVVGWEWLRDRENWNVLMFDFRGHGESSRTAIASTLGYHEIWDVKAVVDYAESKHLPKPFVIFGRSMGAATGLRWASMDARISGVFAVSPYKNAYLASKQLPAAKLRLASMPSPFALYPGYTEMLQAVDIPQALAARNDLRIWIMVGEFDSFPESDQREILAASPSPDGFKRLMVAPHCNHHNVWTFPGDANHPSHDQWLREFLKESNPSTRSDVTALILIGIAFAVGLISLLWFLRRHIAINPEI